MADLMLYNTMAKKEEPFTPIKDGEVTMYTCGPTVYGRPHIGNYASFLMADLLARWLEVSGYKVTHVKNITDVGHLVADQDEGEDKVEKAARAEQVDPLEIARKYEAEYLEDERALNMREPQERPRATETIPEMLALVKTLLKKGNAYETEDGIYFSIETFPEYGKLSGNTLENLTVGTCPRVMDQKRHHADFALWKKCVGENAQHLLRWNFESGERLMTTGQDPSAGFPGWHIECSAMSTKFLGETIDIHTGGEDNIFPHHECEIAQSECASGKPFVQHWLHRRRIDMGKEKMSKSLGNVLIIPDIVEKGFSPLDLRYLFLSVHYRTNLKFSWKGLEDAKKARSKIVEWMAGSHQPSAISHQPIHQSRSSHLRPPRADSGGQAHLRTQFKDAMNADLNTPEALAVIFECMAWSRKQELSKEDLDELKRFIDEVQRTFGCFDPEEQEDIPETVQKLVEEREVARKNKDFDASDQLRDKIRKLGYEVRDMDGGPIVKKV